MMGQKVVLIKPLMVPVLPLTAIGLRAGSHVGGRTHRARENRGIRHLEINSAG